MGSAEPNRSLSSGISIPQWMKNKINDRYDIEETFSPPTHDDTFFYIRYPKSARARTPETKRIVEEPALTTAVPDFSQHTLPCRQFIPSVSMTTDIKGSSFAKPISSRVKPQDDEIAGESGACGKSVVDVAKQMISGKVVRGFSVAGSNDNLSVPSSGFDPAKRRGSRSLPASPLGSPSQSPTSSPRIHRKVAHPNRFFTGTFQVPDKGNSADDSGSNFGSWIWPGFLGNRENAFSSTKTLTIHEEHGGEKSSDELDAAKKETQKVEKSVSVPVSPPMSEKSLNSTIVVGTLSSEKQKGIKLQPKPSELREMNFWSPTSM
ncbi:hypothetical protein R5R35_008858 [Gryllus longicercus]|uniref:Uncharacterized protein n=1 Tax=Gryllus longicercus TaxID=2509291 RepID=A0AAN9Z054_9ORTH